jgi:hypothetical protein
MEELPLTYKLLQQVPQEGLHFHAWWNSGKQEIILELEWFLPQRHIQFSFVYFTFGTHLNISSK